MMVSRWSCKRLCNKGTPGIFQTCQCKIPKLPKSEKDQKVPLKKRRGKRKYRRSFSHLGRRKRELRLTKEGDALATGAKTKTRIGLLVKSHDMFPKSHAICKEIRNEQKTHGHQTGHYANACHNIVYYNCEQLGHLASDCPEPPMCNLCKSTNHKARACQFSWARDTRETSDPESESVTEETPEKTATDDPEELPMTEECDGLLTGQPDAEDNNNSDTQDEYMDAPESDDTFSNEPTDSAELFLSTSTEETPYSLTPAQRKQPAKPTKTIIPGRIPTKPVLVTSTGVKNNLDKTNSGEPLPKRSRTNKKKHKDRK